MPTTIKFCCFAKDSSTTSPSGYCQKLETFFRGTGFTDYTLQNVWPTSAPKGKLPYIVLDRDGRTETIADSHFIVRYLIDNKIVDDPDVGLTASQRGDSRGWQRWTEELVYPALVHSRWGRLANFQASAATLPTSFIPRAIFSRILRRSLLNSLWGHGVGRHTDAEIDSLLQEYIDGLQARLMDHTYFFGNQPTLIDIIVYGFLSNALADPGNPEYKAMILKSSRLKEYVSNLTMKWFPEYKDLMELVGTPVTDSGKLTTSE